MVIRGRGKGELVASGDGVVGICAEFAESVGSVTVAITWGFSREDNALFPSTMINTTTLLGKWAMYDQKTGSKHQVTLRSGNVTRLMVGRGHCQVEGLGTFCLTHRRG